MKKKNKKQHKKELRTGKFNGEKIGILGNGEVGSAIAQFYKNPRIKDLNRDDNLINVDILHVCIPYNDHFLGIVAEEIKKIKPKLTIVHSTVVPGTTKELALKVPGMVVHSPIRGLHPNLYKGIKTFIKYIGSDNKKAGVEANKHLGRLGIKTKVFDSSMSTEVGKLLDTTYYGLLIAWHGEKKKLCDTLGVDFNQAVTDFNKTYNDGYKKLGMSHVVRPILYPPDGYIGGHCITPNAKLLKKYLNSKAIDLILEYEKRV